MKKVTVFLCLFCVCALMVSCSPREIQILAYVDESLSEAEAQALYAEISQIEDVISVKFVSAEEALNDFMKNPENAATFEGVDASALRHRFIVTVNAKDQDAVIKALQQIEGIDDVKANTLSSYL